MKAIFEKIKSFFFSHDLTDYSAHPTKVMEEKKVEPPKDYVAQKTTKVAPVKKAQVKPVAKAQTKPIQKSKTTNKTNHKKK